MKLLLLYLGLSLVCANNEGEMEVAKNFDPSKITGKWFTILLGSDQKEKIEENGSMRVFVEHIDLLKNSSLFFKFHTIVNGQCTEFFVTCDKKEDGVYTVQYDGHNVYSIADVEYDEYVIILLKNEKNFQLAELYGRQPDVGIEIKKKFMAFCEKHGIVEENILDMTEVDRCLQVRSDKVA
ncbi:PREDICTED: allergen Fel d 4-like [Dipodomys ordii]|uniref:Allergen Fel d 4-like n=1 Tax=Dipodomys ordii TaxID=10020 RepID=A0A1S3FS41_DIPOR|nr:PREDICTED: allergen Fel d 4-like [Dipodomys ordii]